jgi:hypothetical protein
MEIEMENLMGPPSQGAWVEIYAKGMCVKIRVNDADDAEILRLALEMAERRRYGR